MKNIHGVFQYSRLGFIFQIDFFQNLLRIAKGCSNSEQ